MPKAPRKKKKHARLGELLLDTGLIDTHQLSVALGQQAKWGGKLGSELIRLGFIGESELAYILQEQLGIKWVSLHDRRIPPEVIQSIPHEIAAKYFIIPIAVSDQSVTIATINPNDLDAMDAIAFAIGKNVSPVMALESDLAFALSRYYEPSSKAKPRVVKATETKSEPDTEIDEERLPSRSVKRLKMRSPRAQETLLRLLIKKGVISWDEFIEEFKESS
jgi:type IV pilus assembly protein PilB